MMLRDRNMDKFLLFWRIFCCCVINKHMLMLCGIASGKLDLLAIKSDGKWLSALKLNKKIMLLGSTNRIKSCFEFSAISCASKFLLETLLHSKNWFEAFQEHVEQSFNRQLLLRQSLMILKRSCNLYQFLSSRIWMLTFVKSHRSFQ